KLSEAETPTVVKPMQASDFLTNKIHYNTFSGRAQAHLVTKDQDQNFSANLKMKKGSVIWSSLIALGIAEVARANITPDSLRALVRIGKKAYAMSYEEGQKFINAEVEFATLQNLLVGNVLVEDMPVKSLKEKDSVVVITTEQGGNTQVLTYGKASKLLKHVSLSAPAKDFSCDISYEKYGPTSNSQPFAYQRKIIIKNQKEVVKLDLDFTRAELDIPLEIAFDIPTSYTLQTIQKKN